MQSLAYTEGYSTIKEPLSATVSTKALEPCTLIAVEYSHTFLSATATIARGADNANTTSPVQVALDLLLDLFLQVIVHLLLPVS